MKNLTWLIVVLCLGIFTLGCGGTETKNGGTGPAKPKGPTIDKGKPTTPPYGDDKDKGDKGDTDKGDADKGDADKGDADKGDADKGDADKGDTDKGDADKGDADEGDTDKGDADEDPGVDLNTPDDNGGDAGADKTGDDDSDKTGNTDDPFGESDE
jgi:hypothetical protein